MENASKALLMAGGVLIAIIIISLLVRTYGNIGRFQRQQLSAEEAEQLEEFNKEYTKYQGQYVYGTEVITVINKAADSDYDIRVSIRFMDDYTYSRVAYKNGKKTTKTVHVKKGETINLDSDTEFQEFIDANSENFGTSTDIDDLTTEVTGLKNKAFQCDDIQYDNTTGRVNYIHFTEKQIT